MSIPFFGPLLGICLCLALPAAAESRAPPLKQPFHAANISRWHVGRLFSVSVSAPVSHGMRRNASARAVVAPTFTLFDTLYREGMRRRNTSHPLACNLPREHAWALGSRQKPRVFQIGHITDACYSFINVNDAVDANVLAPALLTDALQTLQSGRRALAREFAKMRAPRDGNWSRKYDNVERQLEEAGQTCLLETAMAFRVRGRWYVRVAMTNAPVYDKLPDRRRHVMLEWVPQTYDDSLRMIHPRYPRGDVLENCTTLLTMYEGAMAQSTVDPDFSDRYGPLFNAYRQTEIASDQAADSITGSNIAVLALPMVMNLIPVALIAEMNAVGMIAYIVFTDILSSVPFLVKGVELIAVANPSDTVMTAFMVGNDTLAEVELWIVSCRGISKYRSVGIAFVAVGAFAMACGLLLELAGFFYIQSQMEDVGNGGHGPFGAVFKHGWKYGSMERRNGNSNGSGYNQAP